MIRGPAHGHLPEFHQGTGMKLHVLVATAAFGALMTAIGAILADITVVVLDPRVRVG